MLLLYKGKFFPRQGKKEKLYLNYLKKKILRAEKKSMVKSRKQMFLSASF